MDYGHGRDKGLLSLGQDLADLERPEGDRGTREERTVQQRTNVLRGKGPLRSPLSSQEAAEGVQLWNLLRYPYSDCK